MQEKEFDKDGVKKLLTAAIKERVPNFKYINDPDFEDWVDFSLSKVNKNIYTKNEVEIFLNSFVVNKLQAKNILGYYTPEEVELAKCTEHFSDNRKGDANKGGMEWFIRFVLGWEWSDKKGCDLIDPNGKHVDAKLATKFYSNVQFPGQFFDKDGIPFIKRHKEDYKWILYKNTKVWNSNMEEGSEYPTVINHIKSFKIANKDLDRYMFCYLDPYTHILEYVDVTQSQIEQDTNILLSSYPIDIWGKRIDVTWSKWEHGAIKYNIRQIKGVI